MYDKCEYKKGSDKELNLQHKACLYQITSLWSTIFELATKIAWFVVPERICLLYAYNS